MQIRMKRIFTPSTNDTGEKITTGCDGYITVSRHINSFLTQFSLSFSCQHLTFFPLFQSSSTNHRQIFLINFEDTNDSKKCGFDEDTTSSKVEKSSPSSSLFSLHLLLFSLSIFLFILSQPFILSSSPSFF